MGRKRKPEGERKMSLTINLKEKVLKNVEKDGKPKKVIESMVNNKYGKDKD